MSMSGFHIISIYTNIKTGIKYTAHTWYMNYKSKMEREMYRKTSLPKKFISSKVVIV